MCVVGCGPGPAPITPVPPPVEATIPLTDASLGPIQASTRASLIALRAVLRGYTVIPVNVGTDPEFASLEYQVFDNDTPMFVVVPADDGSILNVHVVTPKVTMTSKPWRVGAPFKGAVTDCDCWGGKLVCFTKGEHVAVTFDRRCRSTEDAHKRGLTNAPIKKLVWSPKAFGGDEYGGVEEGSDLIGP
jgi:hypothetical protein